MQPVIPHLFARLAARARENLPPPAHVSATASLSYPALLTRAWAVAAYLRADLGADDHSPVIVLGHKEPEMLAGFLGAVGSGHPYIPLDNSLPPARLAQIRRASGARCLLTPAQIADLPLPATAEALAYWTAAPPLDPQAPFYIIFTSGSTGEPKGVVITTANLDAFVTWMLAEHAFNPSAEVFLNQAPFSFDLSVMDLYLSLVTGGTLHSLSRDEIADFRRLFHTLTAAGLTTWVSTPSFAQLCLAERTFNAQRLPALRRFWFCGETLLPETARQLLTRFPAAEVWNTYGPTEATVATTSVRITPEIAERGGPLPIGRARPGTDVRLEGAEIVIAGPNVSSGYLGQPELTATVFSGAFPQRAYRTGDRGRSEDGLFYFDGRRDAQIKLHGYRIELADIENNLRALAGIRDCAVLPVAKDGTIQFLAAFVIPVDDLLPPAEETPDHLRRALAERLPVYMLPRKFHLLSALPLTPNGKADRRRLAEWAAQGVPQTP